MRKLFSIVFSAVLLLIVSGQGAWAQKVKVYDLGHYPGGTSAQPWDINDFGVIVGDGDNSDENLRAIGVPLRGPHAFQWFDLGTLGGETQEWGWVMAMGAANSGLIVGHAPTVEGYIHAFAWTKQSGMMDLGTLEGHKHSVAYGVNRSGNLIVGFSTVTREPNGQGPDALPVVWTPDGPGKTWKIHKLDMSGFEQDLYWCAERANDTGQIVGNAWDDAAQINLAFVWNRVPGKNEWKIMRLPATADYPNAFPWDINQKGEIVGELWPMDGSTWFPPLWRPLGPSRTAYSVTVLPTLAGYLQGAGNADGINDVGDIVGGSLDADGNYFATHWSTKDHNSARLLFSVPGGWSSGVRVNNNGLAAGEYAVSDDLMQTVAIKLR